MKFILLILIFLFSLQLQQSKTLLNSKELNLLEGPSKPASKPTKLAEPIEIEEKKTNLLIIVTGLIGSLITGNPEMKPEDIGRKIKYCIPKEWTKIYDKQRNKDEKQAIDYLKKNGSTLTNLLDLEMSIFEEGSFKYNGIKKNICDNKDLIIHNLTNKKTKTKNFRRNYFLQLSKKTSKASTKDVKRIIDKTVIFLQPVLEKVKKYYDKFQELELFKKMNEMLKKMSKTAKLSKIHQERINTYLKALEVIQLQWAGFVKVFINSFCTSIFKKSIVDLIDALNNKNEIMLRMIGNYLGEFVDSISKGNIKL